MIFHIFTCILHHLRVYYELTTWPARRWPDSSVGGALHRYHRTRAFQSCSGLKDCILQLITSCVLTAMIIDVFIIIFVFLCVIRQSNQTPRRGNVTNYMAPPSPGARDSLSPSRSSPSSSGRSVPGYMQPTRSSGASKGSGTPRARKGSEKKR